MDIRNEIELFIKSELDSSDKIEILTSIQNGVVSDVYRAKLNGNDVVVKRTKDFNPDYPVPLYISKDMHHVDAHVLGLLETSEVKVPKVLRNCSSSHILILEDMTKLGYKPLSSIILDQKFNQLSGETIGLALSNLITQSNNWNYFETAETAESSLMQRGLELRISYPNASEGYEQIRSNFLSGEKWVWADAHPKNILVNSKGECALIDFSESFFGDNQYTLSNYVAHILIYGLIGQIPKTIAKKHIVACLDVYLIEHKINEVIFSRYVAMEILHRAFGRWIDGVNQIAEKLKLIQTGLMLYENNTTIEGLVKSLIK